MSFWVRACNARIEWKLKILNGALYVSHRPRKRQHRTKDSKEWSRRRMWHSWPTWVKKMRWRRPGVFWFHHSAFWISKEESWTHFEWLQVKCARTSRLLDRNSCIFFRTEKAASSFCSFGDQTGRAACLCFITGDSRGFVQLSNTSSMLHFCSRFSFLAEFVEGNDRHDQKNGSWRRWISFTKHVNVYDQSWS